MKKFISILLCFCLCFSLSAVAFADDKGLKSVWWSKPEMSDRCGYVELLLQSRTNSNDIYVEGFYFSTPPTEFDTMPQLDIIVHSGSPDRIEFHCVNSSTANIYGCYWNLFHYRNSAYEVRRATLSSTMGANDYNYTYSSYKIIGIRLEGNGSLSHDYYTGGNNVWSTDYGREFSNLKGLFRSYFEYNDDTFGEMIYQIMTYENLNNSFLYDIWQKLVREEENAKDDFESAGGRSVGSLKSDMGGFSSSISGSLDTGVDASNSLNAVDNNSSYFEYFFFNMSPDLDTTVTPRMRSKSSDNGSTVPYLLNDYWSMFDD